MESAFQPPACSSAATGPMRSIASMTILSAKPGLIVFAPTASLPGPPGNRLAGGARLEAEPLGLLEAGDRPLHPLGQLRRLLHRRLHLLDQLAGRPPGAVQRLLHARLGHRALDLLGRGRALAEIAERADG